MGCNATRKIRETPASLNVFAHLAAPSSSPVARVENSGYAGSAATGLYPALRDGQFVLTAEEAAGHVARRRKDLDAALTKEEQVCVRV